MNFINDCRNLPDKDYNNWYVLHVKTEKEIYIQSIAKKLLSQDAKLVVFSREIIHKKKENYTRFSKPLFPGYIFVYKEINKIVHELKSYLPNEYIYPVKFNDSPAKVLPAEMKLLLNYSDETGLFKLSAGIREGDSIVITHGPLKNLEANILFINKKKKKAKVKFSLFKQELFISLGLDIVEKKCELAC